MRRSLILVALAALSAPVAAAQERVIDADKVFALLDKFYAIPAVDRSLLAVRYTIVRDGKPAVGLHAFLVLGAKRTPILVSPEGKVLRLPTAAELAAHAQVAIDAPPAVKFSTRLSIDTDIAPAPEVNAALCAQAIGQANAAVRRAAGVMAMLAPKVKAVTFVGAGSGVAVLTDGTSQPLPLINGAPAYDPDAIKAARTIRLARTPSLISLE